MSTADPTPDSLQAKKRLRQLRQAVETYWRIVCGKPKPDRTALLLVDWTTKLDQLSAASGGIGIDLVELAEIFESAKHKIGRMFGRRQPLKWPWEHTESDPVKHTANYLMNQRATTTLLIFKPIASDHYLQAAKEAGDVEFFIKLGDKLREIEQMPESAPPNIDKLKYFFLLMWTPWASAPNEAFWPGLAYMTNPARQQVWKIWTRGLKSEPWAFIKTWQRLGLRSASQPLFRNAFLHNGNYHFD